MLVAWGLLALAGGLACSVPPPAGVRGGPGGAPEASRDEVPLSAIFPDVPVDAIPPLDSPRYQRADEATWLPEAAGVVGYVENGDARAYPFLLMNWHEIVNDTIGGREVLVSYCPLCRSGIVYDRRLSERLLTFGNTGALYESDLVMYDRQTGSYWWQVAGRAIRGPLTGDRLEMLPSMTTTWAEWQALYPDTLVLSRETGHQRDYGRDSFAAYDARPDSGPAFPVSRLDDRLRPKEVVLGLEAAGEARAYPVDRLGDSVVADTVGGEAVVVFSQRTGRNAAAFRPRVGGRSLTFRPVGEAIRDRETGSTWSITGQAVAGPLAGTQLERVPARHLYWFSWASLHPATSVYQGG